MVMSQIEQMKGYLGHTIHDENIRLHTCTVHTKTIQIYTGKHQHYRLHIVVD